MKKISIILLALCLMLAGCSEDSSLDTPVLPPPPQKPDLSGCTADINVSFVWESEVRNARGYSLAFGKTHALSQRVDILDDTNTYNFSAKHSIQRGEKLFAAIGAIRTNGGVYFGPTHEFVFPSCEELDAILDKNPTYPYKNNYVLEISEFEGNTDEPRQVLPVSNYLGEVSKKPVSNIVDLTAVNEKLTNYERGLKDYLSAPFDDATRNISPEPGILIKQKYDQAQRANLTDIPFPEEMPNQMCVEFQDKQPTKAQYSILYKYQHLIPEVPGEFDSRVVTKVLAGAEVDVTDFIKYKNELTEDSLYVGESQDIERRSTVESYFIRKADGFIFYKKVKDFTEREFDENTEEETVINNMTYYGYCYNKDTQVDSALVLKLNTGSSDEGSDGSSEEDEDSEPELPEFNGDMQEYETELVVKLQNFLIENPEESVFNSIASNFINSNEMAEMYDFKAIGKEDYYCREVQNYDRNTSLARGEVNLFNKTVVDGYGPLIPEVSLDKVVTGETNMIRNFDRYRMYTTQKSLVSFYVTERQTENQMVSFIRRAQSGERWYYLRYEQKRFVTMSDQLTKNEVFYAGVCIPR